MSKTGTAWEMTIKYVELIHMMALITNDVPDVVFKQEGLTLPLVPGIWLSSSQLFLCTNKIRNQKEFFFQLQSYCRVISPNSSHAHLLFE